MYMNWIIEKAKAIVLETGEMPPCLFVETDHTDTVILGEVGSADDAHGRAWDKFLMGRFFALELRKKKATRKRQVTALCQVVEIWMGSGKGRRPGVAPEREGIAISTIDVSTMKQDILLYELIRDGSGVVVDLLKEEDAQEVRSALLPCFLAGFKTANQPQSEAVHEFRRVCERYMAYTSN